MAGKLRPRVDDDHKTSKKQSNQNQIACNTFSHSHTLLGIVALCFRFTYFVTKNTVNQTDTRSFDGTPYRKHAICSLPIYDHVTKLKPLTGKVTLIVSSQ